MLTKSKILTVKVSRFLALLFTRIFPSLIIFNASFLVFARFSMSLIIKSKGIECSFFARGSTMYFFFPFLDMRHVLGIFLLIIAILFLHFLGFFVRISLNCFQPFFII